MRRGIPVTITVCAAFAAAGALGAGSVINSFLAFEAQIVDGGGVYRDAHYVYTIFRVGLIFYLYRFTPAGTPYGKRPLYGLADACDADHSPRGGGYFGVRAGEEYILHYTVSTGSLAASWHSGGLTTAYGHSPGSPYFYVGKREYIYRYTTNGSFVSSFKTWTDEWPKSIAVAPVYEGVSGEFVLMFPYEPQFKPVHVYAPSGSLVATFPAPGHYELPMCNVCGPGYPPSYGTTLWCTFWHLWREVWVYQIDIGGNTAVAPASVGRIKALFK